MIAGIIALIDRYGNISSRKRYKGKANRNEIILNWSKFYCLKNKYFYFQVFPDEIEFIMNGYVTISFEDHHHTQFYKNSYHREKIIKEFVLKNKLKKYCLEIVPNA